MATLYLEKLAKDMQLTNLTPDVSLSEIVIDTTEVNRAALQLTGFFDYYYPRRIQIIGKVEMAYLNTLSKEEQFARMEALFRHGAPCVVFTQGNIPDPEILNQAGSCGIPILGTEVTTSTFEARVLRYLEVTLAPMVAIHGVLVDVFGEGVLIQGESGVGKSEAALELIKRGHRLVADDVVEIYRFSENELVGRSPDVTRYLMELRGVGVIDVKSLFGVERVKDKKTISMVIVLEHWDKDRPMERLGKKAEYQEFMGNKLRRFTVPVSPGRNIAVIIETAALHYRALRMGYDPVKELQTRIQEKIAAEQQK